MVQCCRYRTNEKRLKAHIRHHKQKYCAHMARSQAPLGLWYNTHTVNVDIFACINFRGFMKMGNFACIKIRVFSTNDSLGYNDSNFHSVYIYILFKGGLMWQG